MDEGEFARLVAPHRRELLAHCYRMSGSIHDAEDVLQEALVRAWKGIAGFEGRASLRTWLYKVTTNACLDALAKRPPRTLPTEPDLGADPIWIEPCPSELVETNASPEARVSSRESVAFAFLVALQLLPAKQRAVLILRDVLGWQASECGELLDLSVPAVNSALQRARETLEARGAAAREAPPEVEDPDLLGRYLRAWEESDVPALVSLLREDAILAMPPLTEWLRGPDAIAAGLHAMVLGPGSRGAFRLVPLRANGRPAFAAWERGAPKGIHVLEIRGGKIAAITAFLDASLFRAFGLE